MSGLFGCADRMGARPGAGGPHGVRWLVGASASGGVSRVRGGLRRFGSRAEAARGWFTGLLCAVAADPVLPGSAGSVWADAVAAMQAAVVAVSARFAVTGVTVWQVVGAASSGRL